MLHAFLQVDFPASRLLRAVRHVCFCAFRLHMPHSTSCTGEGPRDLSKSVPGTGEPLTLKNYKTLHQSFILMIFSTRLLLAVWPGVFVGNFEYNFVNQLQIQNSAYAL